VKGSWSADDRRKIKKNRERAVNLKVRRPRQLTCSAYLHNRGAPTQQLEHIGS
jgi:hypothetical protein